MGVIIGVSSIRLIAQSQQVGLDKLLSWVNTFLKGEAEFRFTTNPRLAAEMILIQAIHDEKREIHTTDSTKQPKVADNQPKTKENHNTNKTANTVSGQPDQNTLPGLNISFESFVSKWPQVLEEVRRKKRSTHAFLLEGTPAALSDGILSLVFKEGYSFHRDKFNQLENKSVVEEVIAALLGIRISVSSLMENEFASEKNSAEVKGKDPADPGNSANKDSDFCITKAIELFGPDLVQVKKDPLS